jgi:hypothetical protein
LGLIISSSPPQAKGLLITLSLEVLGFVIKYLHNVLNMRKTEINNYYVSPEYHADLANGLTPSTKSAAALIQAEELTAFEFQFGIKHDKTNYHTRLDALCRTKGRQALQHVEPWLCCI